MNHKIVIRCWTYFFQIMPVISRIQKESFKLQWWRIWVSQYTHLNQFFKKKSEIEFQKYEFAKKWEKSAVKIFEIYRCTYFNRLLKKSSSGIVRTWGPRDLTPGRTLDLWSSNRDCERIRPSKKSSSGKCSFCSNIIF